MKLTWFAGTTFRIEIGGAILVIDPQGAPDGVNARELVSGADRAVRLGDPAIAAIDARLWTPRRAGTLLAETREGLLLHRAGGAVIAEVPGESPLAVAWEAPPPAGWWARDAVLVACGAEAAAVAEAGLDQWGPRLIALAAGEAGLDAAFARLAGRLGETGLVALEPGLALEV